MDNVDDTINALGLGPTDCMLIVCEFKQNCPFSCFLQASKLSFSALEPVNQCCTVGTNHVGIKSLHLLSFEIETSAMLY